MGRVLKILLYLVLLFVLYIWLSTVFKSCNSGNSISGTLTETVDATGDTVGDITDAGDELLDEVDDFFEDDKESDNEDFKSDDFDEKDVDYEALDAEEDYQDEDIYEDEGFAAPAKVEKPTAAAPTPKPTKSTSTGNYFVITGSYLVESNARVMRDKLAKMGYDSEVVIFDGSQYHAAIAGRFASHEDAREVSRKLTGKGIDNFIQKQKL